MMKNKTKLILLLLIISLSNFYGQIENYSYKNKIEGIADTWHKIQIPKDVFGKINSNFSDIRIYGISENRDEIEAPYILKINKGSVDFETVDFEIINNSYRGMEYFVTLVNISGKEINQIDLNFESKNYEYKLKLEGSNDENSWFTIKENYRILSIRNEITSYDFNTIKFPKSSYKYYRLRIQDKANLSLKNASVSLSKITKPTYNSFEINGVSEYSQEKYGRKQSVFDIRLNKKVPVSFLKFNVIDSIDYYRPIQVQYISDSFKVKNGVKYIYETILSTTLSSLEKSEFKFESTITDKIRILIDNNDNEKLEINNFEFKGYSHELVARFLKPGNYYLVYGNKKSNFPKYDITKFTNKIPEELQSLQVGNMQIIPQKVKEEPKIYFDNKVWLWVVILVVIGVLGWFTFKMMRETSTD